MAPGSGDLSRQDREDRISRHGRESVYLAEEKARAKIVCSCIGGLVEPKSMISDTPGFDRFQGALLHSARWDRTISLKDKDVVVIGTGCSAAQLVPQLTKPPYSAKSVIQLMRSAPWVVPGPEAPGGDESYAKWAPKVFSIAPPVAKLLRALMFLAGEIHYFSLFPMTKFAEYGRPFFAKQSTKLMEQTAPEKYQDMLRPDYPIGCKRRIFGRGWYSGLADPKIDLTTQPLRALGERSITLGPIQKDPNTKIEAENELARGRELPADVIVLATGFQATACLGSLKVSGKGGADIHEVWEARGGPQAYMGTAMDGFPNLFMVYGPNTVTGHGSVVFTSECTVEYIIKFVRPIVNNEIVSFEIKKEKEIAWANTMQKKLRNTVMHTGGCSNWYINTNGWNPTAWP